MRKTLRDAFNGARLPVVQRDESGNNQTQRASKNQDARERHGEEIGAQSDDAKSAEMKQRNRQRRPLRAQRKRRQFD